MELVAQGQVHQHGDHSLKTEIHVEELVGEHRFKYLDKQAEYGDITNFGLSRQHNDRRFALYKLD